MRHWPSRAQLAQALPVTGIVLRTIGGLLSVWLAGVIVADWYVDETIPRWMSSVAGIIIAPPLVTYLWMWPVVRDPWALASIGLGAGAVASYPYARRAPEIATEVSPFAAQAFTFIGGMVWCIVALGLVLSIHLWVENRREWREARRARKESQASGTM